MVSAGRGTAEMPGAVLLPDSGRPSALSRAAAAASLTVSRDGAIYDRHAAGLYRQALLTLGDAGMAEQVVSDVVLDECLRSAPPEATQTPQSCAWGYWPAGGAKIWPGTWPGEAVIPVGGGRAVSSIASRLPG